MKWKMTVADLLLIFIVLGITAMWIQFGWQPTPNGDLHAQIHVSGKLIQTVNLNDAPQTITVRGPIGDAIIEFKDHQARFMQSPCDGKQCVHTGWLKHSGSTAICMPNEMSITLTSDNQAIDGMTF